MKNPGPATSRRTWFRRAGFAALVLPLILVLGWAGVSPYREGLRYMEDENWDQAVLSC